jgi:hypothetical protein
VVPIMWCLLHAIKRFVKPTHQLKVSGVNEAGKLGAIDHLMESVVEEGVLDVQLVHMLTTGDS